MTNSAASTEAQAPDRGVMFAIGFMCLSVVFFSILDTSVKYLGETLKVPVTQIIWIRFLSHIAVSLVFLGPAISPKLLKSNKPGHQVLRSFLMLGATGFNFYALKYLQLDQIITIFFLSPLIVAALAGPFLGEWVGWRRLVAILFGFTGVIVVMRPGFGGIHPAAILALIAALSFSLYTISTRYLAEHDTPQVTLFYSPIAGALAFAPAALLYWEWPSDAFTWIMLLSLGVSGAIGHWLLIIAHKYAPASLLAPYIYTGLVVNSLFGFLIFDDVPTAWTLAGGMIVIFAGLYLLYREKQKEKIAKKQETA